MKKYTSHFDLIIIGGGHAGIEAAYVAANMGSRVLLITLHLDTIGLMACNPSIGGVGKGHLVHEISALGGLMPKLCTSTYLQARMLNTRKGPAVQGLRVQIDKYAYATASKAALEQHANITLRMGMVTKLLTDPTTLTIQGIKTRDGATYYAPTVIIATGTFLRGLLHIGNTHFPGGRQGEEHAEELSYSLQEIGLKLSRLKTGTPPRIHASSIDFSKLEHQESHTLPNLFEISPQPTHETHPCFIAYTNEKTHEIIRENIHRSALFNGKITSAGPRYCPSIEDKINRFPQKTSHHVFVEPESKNIREIYPNGLSTSLPYDVQRDYIQSIVGFEHAIITRPGYAVEYDFAQPDQLKKSLEVAHVPGLFLAGQINGTTGYEEAAAQGLIAGINAHLYHTGQKAYIPDRNESYIGVMIDDLITLGVDEPYRMFTSRAERRLLLRQDNAFLRLMATGHQLGTVNDSDYTYFVQEKTYIEATLAHIATNYTQARIVHHLEQYTDHATPYTSIIPLADSKHPSERTLLTIFATLLYQPYLAREEQEIQRAQQLKTLRIPASLHYCDLPGLSKELQEKLMRYKPSTIADAMLIPGITPAALSLLIFKTRQELGLLRTKK